MRRSMLIGIAILCLSGCGPVDDERPEYWLEQYSSFRAEWDRVARVFGFYDDLEGCEMIVKALAATEPKARYRCVRAVGGNIGRQ